MILIEASVGVLLIILIFFIMRWIIRFIGIGLRKVLESSLGELEYNKLKARLLNVQIRKTGSGLYYIRRGWLMIEFLNDCSTTTTSYYDWTSNKRWMKEFKNIELVGRVYHEFILNENTCSVEVFVEKVEENEE